MTELYKADDRMILALDEPDLDSARAVFLARQFYLLYRISACGYWRARHDAHRFAGIHLVMPARTRC